MRPLVGVINRLASQLPNDKRQANVFLALTNKPRAG
jgi:hypothetical protein